MAMRYTCSHLFTIVKSLVQAIRQSCQAISLLHQCSSVMNFVTATAARSQVYDYRNTDVKDTKHSDVGHTVMSETLHV